jgi:branched-chain amino acid transport system permease protein
VKRTLALTAIAVAALAPPLLAQDYFLYQLTQAGIYAIAILGLGLITGISGQISLGQGAFYAMGAYLSAVLVTHADLPLLPAAGFATLFCIFAGWLFGRPAARLEGLFLAMATFALAVAMPQLLKSALLRDWTGGVQGLELGVHSLSSGGALESDLGRYLLVCGVLVTVMLLMSGMTRGRMGRAWRAIRDDPRGARACGIDLPAARALAFAVGAGYAGLAGALGAMLQGYVSPDGFGFSLSLLLFVGMVVGGAGSLWGAVLGGLFIVLVPNVADGLDRGLAGAVFGATLILASRLFPAGIAGLIQRWTTAVAKTIER